MRQYWEVLGTNQGFNNSWCFLTKLGSCYSSFPLLLISFVSLWPQVPGGGQQLEVGWSRRQTTPAELALLKSDCWAKGDQVPALGGAWRESKVFSVVKEESLDSRTKKEDSPLEQIPLTQEASSNPLQRPLPSLSISSVAGRYIAPGWSLVSLGGQARHG